ncbi:MAG: 3-dehydroquinate synthase [Saprospiraceae bacterium]
MSLPLPMTILELSDYNIYIGSIGLELSPLVAKGNYSQVAILVDENTRQHCLPILSKSLNADFRIIEIQAGEWHKNLDSCRHIWEEMMKYEMDRHSLLINLGGGVIGDMGGFCAATFLRGIDFIQIPTTLLSQVDASVGGKLGIDFNSIKNSIGVFQNPQAVFVDPEFLKSLPNSEIRSGFAEVFKHALIADADLWSELFKLNDLSEIDWAYILARSLRIKQHVVEADPLEKGLRKALNFGHTIGHAVESFSLKTDKPLLHGEAVAIGIVCESWLSNQAGDLSEIELKEITNFVEKIYPFYTFDETNFPEIMAYMKKDKKNRAGVINFTFLNTIGQATIDQTCDEKLIEESLLYYMANK